MWGIALVLGLLGPCGGLLLERQQEGDGQWLGAREAEAEGAAREAAKKGNNGEPEKRTVDDVCSDKGAAEVYREPRRPQFHFSAAQNWINDPNGLVYHKGVYHLYFQRNPEANVQGHATWGHAESTDLLHWEQVPDAITPDEAGLAYSGSAVVDWHNTSGFQQLGQDPPLIAIYTVAQSMFSTQRIAYSHDGGRVWTKVLKDVLPSKGQPRPARRARDPLVRWHQPSGRWVMILAVLPGNYQLFASPDLQSWEHLSSINFDGAFECPDMFEMPVAGEPQGQTKWVVIAASGEYLVGDFDGSKFTSDGPSQLLEFGLAYAGQTFNEEPKGRRVQISWLQQQRFNSDRSSDRPGAFQGKSDSSSGAFKGTAFSGMMTFPAELELARIPDSQGPGALRLRKRPIKELETLRFKPFHAASSVLQPDAPLWTEEDAEQHGAGLEIQIRARIPPGEARLAAHPPVEGDFLSVSLRGETILINTPQALGTIDGAVYINKWSMPVKFVDGAMEICILTDRTTIEIYDLIGGTSLSIYHDLPCDGAEWRRRVEVGAKRAGIVIDSLDVYHLSSTLPSHAPRQLQKRLLSPRGQGLAEWEEPAGNPKHWG